MSARRRAKDAPAPKPTEEAKRCDSALMNWLPWAIVIAAFLLRVFRLMDVLPVVGDESIYLRWAEIIDHQGEWMVSTLDGKAPLSYWLYAACRWIWDDPLFGPRLISAVAGAATTAFVYGIGCRLHSRSAGIAAASLYALLPWAMLYDRLAYTEGLVNLGGAATVYLALRAFAAEQPTWKAAVWAGVALGLSLFTKSTALLYAPAPLLAALLLGRPRAALARLAVCYGIALVFPLLSATFTPAAPVADDSSVVFHKTHFFRSPAELAAAPLAGAVENLPALADSAGAYLTWPGVGLLLGGLALLLRRQPRTALFLLAISIVPILAQVLLLDRYYSRYPYPHLWPLLVGTALAVQSLKPRLAAHVGVGALLLVFAVQTSRLLFTPAVAMSEYDSAYYFGDGPNAGWGLDQALEHIRSQAEEAEPALVLTDPIWGTPADALFAYLNERDGVRVVEAWWLDPAGGDDLAILPAREVQVWKSHYQRVAGGTVDFTEYRRVFYVTLTNYRSHEAVRRGQPGARLELSIPKPGGVHSLDVWRVR